MHDDSDDDDDDVDDDDKNGIRYEYNTVNIFIPFHPFSSRRSALVYLGLVQITKEWFSMIEPISGTEWKSKSFKTELNSRSSV